MNTGKTLFAQLMALPAMAFTRIVDRMAAIQTGSGPRFRVPRMPIRRCCLIQLTYREEPARHRDAADLGPRIETLSHGVPPASVRRSTLADANERREVGVIHAALAQRLITQARRCTSTKNWGWT